MAWRTIELIHFLRIILRGQQIKSCQWWNICSFLTWRRFLNGNSATMTMIHSNSWLTLSNNARNLMKRLIWQYLQPLKITGMNRGILRLKTLSLKHWEEQTSMFEGSSIHGQITFINTPNNKKPSFFHLFSINHSSFMESSSTMNTFQEKQKHTMSYHQKKNSSPLSKIYISKCIMYRGQSASTSPKWPKCKSPFLW